MELDLVNKALTALEESRKNIEALKNVITQLENEKKDLENKVADLNKKLSECVPAEKIEELQRKLEESEKTRREIEARLEKVSSLYKELQSKAEKKVDVEDLLAIYIALLENVFHARPHAKILWLLHGEAGELPLKGLIDATGFSPADVRHALTELSGGGLVEYDAETGKAKLLKRIF
ncbi:MAG: hypothetical protein QXL15_03060, partial [Candidatus Korarchaeota archaeon]